MRRENNLAGTQLLEAVVEKESQKVRFVRQRSASAHVGKLKQTQYSFLAFVSLNKPLPHQRPI
jgi:hypothetical protein